MKRSLPERDITAHEAAIIEWLLDHAAVRDVTAYRTNPVTALRVVGGCDYGCSSLDFRTSGRGSETMLADAVAEYPDNKEGRAHFVGPRWRDRLAGSVRNGSRREPSSRDRGFAPILSPNPGERRL